MGASRIEGIMAATARVLMERAALYETINTKRQFFQAAAANRTRATNETLELISDLVFAESKSVRTSTLILAAFNILAAFATAASILYDCYWASKTCSPNFRASKFRVSAIHPAETFPLVISIGIVIQGLIFAGVQGEGLNSLFTEGCGTIAQFMWPALFIVPYLQLVFGIECGLRSLRALPFQARGKYDVTICLLTVVIMLIATWIPSNISHERNICFASLVWFVTRYGKLGFVLLSIVGTMMIFSALTIFIRLSTDSLIDEHQRIAASRMVYYLVLGLVSLSFVLPWFFSLSNEGEDGNGKLAMMATVVLNLSGLMTGLLQLFLRTNTATTSFAPRSGTYQSWDKGRHTIRIFGPNEMVMRHQMANPIEPPKSPGSAHEMGDRQSRTDSHANLVHEKERPISMDSLPSPDYHYQKTYDDLPAMPAPTNNKSPSRGHAQKSAYSLFPNEGGSPFLPQQIPVSIYDINDFDFDLAPPDPSFKRTSRHKRDSSVVSSATVQIGLRLSHAPDGLQTQDPTEEDLANLPQPPAACKSKAPAPPSPISLSSSTYSTSPLPSIAYSATTPKPPTSPLRVRTSSLPETTFQPSVAISPQSPRRPSLTPAPLATRSSPELSPAPVATRSSPELSPAPVATRSSPELSPAPVATRSSTELSPRILAPATTNKTLPNSPKAFLPSPAAVTSTQRHESTTQLSPTVYSPEKKLTPESIRLAVAVASFAGPMSSNPLKDSTLTPTKGSGSPLGEAGKGKGIPLPSSPAAGLNRKGSQRQQSPKPSLRQQDSQDEGGKKDWI